MYYKSISDLSQSIRLNTYKIPQDIDLIIGIPRSGLFAGSMVALHLNKNICAPDAYIQNAELKHGQTRRTDKPALRFAKDAKHILVVDDSISTGQSMEQIRELLDKHRSEEVRFTYLACYATRQAAKSVDIHFEIVSQPRIFEWNAMHRPFLEDCCVDIDGVLCVDPTDEDNDDGEKYRNFLRNAKLLTRPTHVIGHLVTSRLEKYRPETVEWLNANGIAFKELHMLNLPSAEERRRLGVHGSFKADIYKNLAHARLFIESETAQAQEISEKSGKPCLCYTTQQVFYPGISINQIHQKSRNLTHRLKSKIVRLKKKYLA